MLVNRFIGRSKFCHSEFPCPMEIHDKRKGCLRIQLCKGEKLMSEKFIFIDRDGVINKDPGGWTPYSYVTKLSELEFLPGALEALAKLNRAGFKVVVISNQAGVGKGHFTKRQLEEVNSFILAEVKRHGGNIQESFYCIHKREDNCSCRKPKTGLLEMAAKKYHIVPRDTFFIGDSEVDIESGAAVGASTVFVLSGKNTMDTMKKFPVKPDFIFKDLLEAVEWILAKERRKAERANRRKYGEDKRGQPS